MIAAAFLTAGSLLVLAAAPGTPACAPPKPARIDISPSTSALRIDHAQSLAQLQGVKTDTVNPYGFHDVTRMEGFMEGSIRMTPAVRLGYAFDPARGTYCLWYDTVEVKLEIEPAITVAKEIYADSCLRKAVMDHEMKHVEADRRVVNTYARIMGRKLYGALSERGFSAGPVAQAQGQETAARMQKTVYQVLEHEYKKMQLERTEIQQAIDSRAEYDRVSGLCARSGK